MKKFIFLASLLAFLGACSQQDDFMPDSPQLTVSDPYTGTAHDIYVNVLTNRFGGYHKNRPNTRAEGAFSITPYIEESDTLMYVVQYDKGWELYSASKATNMLIFSSEEGIFDMEDENMPKAMRTLLEAELENIRISNSLEEPSYDNSWGSAALTADKLSNGSVSVCKNGVQSPLSFSDTPPGKWVVIDTKKVSEDTYTSPKFIKTQWNDEYPWNTHCHFSNHSNQIVYANAGCSPVAIAQYMYYTNSKDGVPATAYSSANVIALGSGFGWEFTTPSSSIWKQMALDSSQDDKLISNSSLLIGAVGAETNTQYDSDRSTTAVANVVNYLFKVYNKQFTTASFDIDYIKRSLDSKYPVFASAAVTSANQIEDSFLIDQYSTVTTTYKYTYGLIVDPWTGEGECPWEDNERDALGNIIGYPYTNEVYNSYTLDQISMNWGKGQNNNSIMYSPSGNWDTASGNFNYNRTILKRSDIK